MAEDDQHLLRAEARKIFGDDAAGYEAGRPEYPEPVYETLRTRCGLREGVSVLEVGPGTGLATRRLVEAGARVVGVEPDPQMRSHLARGALRAHLDLVPAALEDADLPAAAFDLVVAAASFHWVDQVAGLAKLGRLLRPGGWVALWWTIFGYPECPDPFADAVQHALGEDLASQRSHSSFALDVPARLADLGRLGGLCDGQGELIRWSIQLDGTGLRALYGSLIRIRRRPPDERQAILATMAAIADEQFGGTVERPVVTALYTARRPADGG